MDIYRNGLHDRTHGLLRPEGTLCYVNFMPRRGATTRFLTPTAYQQMDPNRAEGELFVGSVLFSDRFGVCFGGCAAEGPLKSEPQ